jgi:hypothetical protein
MEREGEGEGEGGKRESKREREKREKREKRDRETERERDGMGGWRKGGREERDPENIQVILLTCYLFKARGLWQLEKDSIGCWSENVWSISASAEKIGEARDRAPSWGNEEHSSHGWKHQSQNKPKAVVHQSGDSLNDYSGYPSH